MSHYPIWIRRAMDTRTEEMIAAINPQALDVCEVSGSTWSDIFPWKSYVHKDYPEFDVCTMPFEEKYDLIVAEQVFEHVRHPWAAAKNIYEGLRPGGYFLISTPFLFHLHPAPLDCWRWTPQGMGFMLEDAGFKAEDIKVESWGNFEVFLRHAMHGDAPLFDGTQPMHNVPHIPTVVWALARKSEA